MRAVTRPVDCCAVSHMTYGLTMENGLWHAACCCGWRSTPSAHLAAQTDALDGHLRVVVVAEQRPSRVRGAAAASVVQVVDHTTALGVVALCLALARPLLARGRLA